MTAASARRGTGVILARCSGITVGTTLGLVAKAYTEGADPEYEEQVLPLVVHHLRGSGTVLDVGCGEGQVTRRIARLGSPR